MSSGRNDEPPVPLLKKIFGPMLQAGTAGTLFAESAIHRLDVTARPFAQIGIGYGQRSIGVLGLGYYGKKAWDEGGIGNYAKAIGYGAFSFHGYARMAEAQGAHAPWTAASGAGAAAFKGAASSPFSFPGFVADLAANVVEFGHSFHHPKASWQKTLAYLSHQVTPQTLIRTQRGGAAALFGAAIYEGYKKLTDKH